MAGTHFSDRFVYDSVSRLVQSQQVGPTIPRSVEMAGTYFSLKTTIRGL